MNEKCALFSCMRGGLHDDCKRSHVERKVQRVILILSATLVAFLGAGGVSGAAEIHGRVVRIADGDTLTLVTGGSRPVATAPAATQHKIRLYGIDAPARASFQCNTGRFCLERLAC